MHWRGHPYFFPLFFRRHFHSRVCPPVPTLPGHFVFTAAASFRCHCPYLGFLPVSSSFSLSFSQFLYSLHECSFGDVSTLFCSLRSPAPHLNSTFSPLSPSFSPRWMPELEHLGHDLLHFLHRQGNNVFLYTQSFSLLLCIPEHSRARSCLFFPLSALLISTSQ